MGALTRRRLPATLATVGCATPALARKKTAMRRHPVARKSALTTRKENSILLTIAALRTVVKSVIAMTSNANLQPWTPGTTSVNKKQRRCSKEFRRQAACLESYSRLRQTKK